MTTVMDKDRLAAFVDGELPPEQAAAVAMHLADHPADQAYVDDLYAANEALARAFAAPLTDPVPPAIMAAIMGQGADVVVPLRRHAANSVPLRRHAANSVPLRRHAAMAGMALAAALAAVALLWPGLTAPSAGIALGPIAAADPVADLLTGSPSGLPVALPDGRHTMVLASFAMPDGHFCREFEVVDATAGRVDFAVGCHRNGTWVVEAAIAEVASLAPDQGYVPADGGEAETLTRYLERGGQPLPLDPAAEAAAIARLWSAP